MAGPYPYPDYPQQPLPPQQGAPQPYPGPVPSAYPGMLPPPVQYPRRNRKKLVFALVAAILVAVVVAGVLVFASRDDGATQTAGPLTDARARTAIQGYLDALAGGDDQQIARHALCGLFDAVTEKKSDLALAGLASDAFRKQFSRAEVTSIDTIVPWSANQAQVLFTMRVAPARGSARGQQPPNEEEQAVAQLLIRDDEVLVCSYLLRTGSQY
ncbi:hypothetical protein [Mycobacterium sp. GA-2829]|uniref:Rv0361 family membrane protein n=1 Tax=Mycobacterium sp. GA-2829 TaxID=1772283 RepID=UPI00073FAA6C|nr:hypothetical protein [Mycobacterium sp. GA-2829]KUI40133.1 hypothetical protein AU194_11665 [Mycobacterium sp. GA-2829]